MGVMGTIAIHPEETQLDGHIHSEREDVNTTHTHSAADMNGAVEWHED